MFKIEENKLKIFFCIKSNKNLCRIQIIFQSIECMAKQKKPKQTW